MHSQIEAFDEDGHPHYFDRDVWDALTRLGLTSADAIGRPTFDSREVDLGKFPQLAVCDFCHARPVTWEATCGTFDTKLSDYTSLGNWLACEACGQAIQAGDKATLHRRVLEPCRVPPDPRNRALFHMTVVEMLTLFWSHYEGRITPFPPPESSG